VLRDLEASSIAPDTKLTHYFYRCPWHYLGEPEERQPTPASAVAAQAVAGPAAAAAAASSSAGTGFQEVAAPSARHF